MTTKTVAGPFTKEQAEAIAQADAYLNNAGLPTYSEMLCTLRPLHAAVLQFVPLAKEWPEWTSADAVLRGVKMVNE